MSEKDTRFSSKRRLVQAVLTATLASNLLVLADGSAPAAPQARAHAQVTTPAAATARVQTRDDRLALQTLNDIVQGNFTMATAHFDATMRKQLPPDALAKAWNAYQDQFGRYQSHANPKDTAFGKFTVVSVPLRMEHQPGEFRASFNKDGTIAGLFLLKPGVPIS
ncbi:DUF3887 domain-containing protein [Streptomyces cellostaticus]|nr:DUF3887 domain-containing protein [Streptomyces cellostaticus]GHI09476.1 hypothetical protein Scel_77970 [Streptomyces cellostaticus]